MTLSAERACSASLTRGLLRCGVVAGPLFVAAFIAEGARRPGYRPLRHPVSSLSLGPCGWVQVANFSVAGALCLAGAAGLSRAPDPATDTRLGPALIGAAAVGLLGSALFNTDPVSGYPPGTPDALTGQSTSMTMHSVAALPVFLGLPAAAIAYAWRFLRGGKPRWAMYSVGTAASMLANIGLAGAGFSQSPRLVNLAGLFQRVSIGTGFAWITAMSARALKLRSQPQQASPAGIR